MSVLARCRTLCALTMLAAIAPAEAAELPTSQTFAALSSDQNAARIGDSLTVLIFENSSASRSISARGERETRINALGYDGAGPKLQPEAALGSGFAGAGRSSRADNLVAQISVTVQTVLPNGDLLVGGNQLLRIDGEKTRIRLRGKVRPADISAANTVRSSLLSDVLIDYEGSGFSTRSGKPGLVARVLTWLGL